jgi:hypothetical protein
MYILSGCELIDTENNSCQSSTKLIDLILKKYQPARQNMKFVTHSLRSLANKLHILARQADIFGINQFTSR